MQVWCVGKVRRENDRQLFRVVKHLDQDDDRIRVPSKNIRDGYHK